MGWLGNRRWLKSLEQQQLPSIDHAKRAATKAELKVAKHLRKHPKVLAVHHAVRLTKIEGGKSRREVDLIAVMADRILLIEVKNFGGTISMDEEGILHQNGHTRRWSFSKLDDATKRLKDTMGLTGIVLGSTEVHSVLMFQGTGRVDSSVNVGQRLVGAHVANGLNELIEVVEVPLNDDARMSQPLLDAVGAFFSRCGTWDEAVANNGAGLDGDLRSSEPMNGWREKYQELTFSNQRGWWGTVFFGPKFGADARTWDDETERIDVDIDESIELIGAGSKTHKLRADHVKSITFGYRSLPDWSNLVLMESAPAEMETSAPAQPKKKERNKPQSSQPPFKKGDVIESATVSGSHEEHGIFFTLSKEHNGLYRKENMEPTEWAMREVLYRVGSDVNVKVIKVKRKGKSGWNIEVISDD